MGLQANAPPPPPPDLQTLLKEHLSSLPADLKDAVEKIVEPKAGTYDCIQVEAVGWHFEAIGGKESHLADEGRCSEAAILGSSSRAQGLADEDRGCTKRASRKHGPIQSTA